MNILFLIYGIVSYAIFFVTFLYAMGFVGNLVVPVSIDSAPASPLMRALVVNGLLLTVFAVQHSVMARPAFKKWWTQIVPQPVERSTYVLFSSLALLLLFFKWEPLGGMVWDVSGGGLGTALQVLFFLGWLTVLCSTFMIDHFGLFGLRQVYDNWRGTEEKIIPFKTPFLYKWVRHPIMMGFLIGFWATPTMTAAHLLFAVATTGYIFVGVFLEERDLIDTYGDTYRDYKKKVWSLLPLPF